MVPECMSKCSWRRMLSVDAGRLRTVVRSWANKSCSQKASLELLTHRILKPHASWQLLHPLCHQFPNKSPKIKNTWKNNCAELRSFRRGCMASLILKLTEVISALNSGVWAPTLEFDDRYHGEDPYWIVYVKHPQIWNPILVVYSHLGSSFASTNRILGLHRLVLTPLSKRRDYTSTVIHLSHTTWKSCRRSNNTCEF